MEDLSGLPGTLSKVHYRSARLSPTSTPEQYQDVFYALNRDYAHRAC